MCLMRLHLFQCSLFLFMFYFFILDVAGFSNNSDEIKNIFQSDDSSKHVPVLKKILPSGNFAEGGLINTAVTTTTTKNNQTISTTKQKTFSQGDSSTESFSVKVSTEPQNITIKAKQETHTQTHLPTHFKLNETGDNLFLGVPEVIHANGTSSVKPRKGVEFNKIVPRKGVDNDNETNYKNSCFWVNLNTCYSALDFKDVDCSCCNKSDYLGRIIQQQPVINCSTCTPLQPAPLGTCSNICCRNKIQEKESYSVTTTEDVLDFSYKNLLSKKQSHKPEKKVASVAENVKRYKPKPTITKVPYDVEVDTMLLGKAGKDVFVPVVVSVFLLPLLGVVGYFVWRRTKDYWDTRYYKRMDFLIDGMYND